MSRLRVGVVGVGHLGQAHARIFASLPEVELVGVADTNAEQARMVADRHETVAFNDYRELLPLLDAGSVVVPTVQHLPVARDFLIRRIPVLVEKPLALNLAEADELVRLAQAQQTLMQVGHIERYNPAFEELQRRPIQPKYVECERHGPFTGRSTDIGAVLDLMIHDLDLLLTLIAGPVCKVEALGVAVFGGHEDIVNARLTFASGCVATLTASRVTQAPKRRLRIWAPEGYAGIDFVTRRLTLVQPSLQLRHQGLNPSTMSPQAREALKSEVFGKHLEVLELDCNRGDQLTSELSDFVTSVRKNRPSRVPGPAGRNAIALAERIIECIQTHRWDGKVDGATGPANMPRPIGRLFDLAQERAA